MTCTSKKTPAANTVPPAGFDEYEATATVAGPDAAPLFVNVAATPCRVAMAGAVDATTVAPGSATCACTAITRGLKTTKGSGFDAPPPGFTTVMRLVTMSSPATTSPASTVMTSSVGLRTNVGRAAPLNWAIAPLPNPEPVTTTVEPATPARRVAGFSASVRPAAPRAASAPRTRRRRTASMASPSPSTARGSPAGR